MRRVLALAAALLLLPVPARAQDGTASFLAYIAHQSEALGSLEATPDGMILWGAEQLAWSRENPPDPCYIEAFTVGVAVAEAVRASGYMATDVTTVAVSYLEEVVTPLMEEWVAVAGESAC